ncbi:DUF6318 family protein [Xylanimonas ulmi]|uniref:DUF6318 domain-containing protein n=1 Tax=Xylanimonas ulmi TaxID=228973 RepID=A0A4Q7M4M0_9MICO|nr:DUF6318 family protein [Xylanibacterium ulmi]RZS62896.1 hypothetical protein EV386_3252 [Xylanibacterium ulmi]
MGHRVRRGAAVLGALILLGGVGCSPDGRGPDGSRFDGGAGADAEVTDSPSEPSPTPSRVVVKPERPAAMDDDGPAGAEAAATYFLQLDSYTQATGDTAEWEAMSHSTCDYCADLLAQARRVQHEGYTWEGGEVSVRVLHTYAQDAATGIWPIDVEITQAPATVTDANGSIVTVIDSGQGDRRVEVARRDGRWVFFEAGNIPGR